MQRCRKQHRNPGLVLEQPVGGPPVVHGQQLLTQALQGRVTPTTIGEIDRNRGLAGSITRPASDGSSSTSQPAARPPQPTPAPLRNSSTQGLTPTGSTIPARALSLLFEKPLGLSTESLL